MLYPSSSSVQMVMMVVEVVSRGDTSRRINAIDKGCRRRRHNDGSEFQEQARSEQARLLFLCESKCTCISRNFSTT